MLKSKMGIVNCVVAAAGGSLLTGCLEAPAEAPSLGAVDQPTICGTTDESEHVNLYTGSFERFSTAFVRSRKGAVGAMETTNSGSADVKFCSGTLIASNLFLTAGHCVDSSTVGEFVAFNYELTLIPFITIGPQTHVRITEVVEDSRGGVDYAIVRLAGSPGASFGVTAVATADAAVGAPIAMIGHPAGDPKMVEAGTVDGASDASFVRYFNLDTLGGSSGSGILNPAGQIVGVHTNGGCTPSGGTNFGAQISRIRAVSNVL
jgi:V8-like Glu-specific endopeptidase